MNKNFIAVILAHTDSFLQYWILIFGGPKFTQMLAVTNWIIWLILNTLNKYI